MTGIETAAKVLEAPLADLYSSGKKGIAGQLSKWKNARSRKTLARKISTIEQVKTFWQRDRAIPLSSFYYPSKIRLTPSGTSISAATLHSLPRGDNVVIQGSVGQGKSILLRHLCVQELTRFGTGRIPVFIELRSVSSKGLMASIHSAFDVLGFEINDELFDYYAGSGKIVLLLDAFDELDESLVKSTMHVLERLSDKYDSLQIVITSRPDSEIQKSRLFRVIQLAPLSSADHFPFLRRIGLAEPDAKRMVRAIRASSTEINTLLTTPLMLSLMVVVYQAEQTIPSELQDFYEKLFVTLFTKHDNLKPGFRRKHRTGLSERQLQQLFEAFCFSVLQFQLPTALKDEKFRSSFDQALKYVDFRCELEDFRDDIVKVTCLMIEEGLAFHFIHKSVLEFFASSFISRSNEASAERFYSQVRERWHHWRQVLVFLSQMDPYRYAKHFALPELDRFLGGVGIHPDSEAPPDPRELVERLYQGVKISVDGEDAGGFGPFGGFDAASSIYYDEFPTLMLHLIDPLQVSVGARKAMSASGEDFQGEIAWQDGLGEEGMRELLQLVADEIEMLIGYRKRLLADNARADQRAQLIQI